MTSTNHLTFEIRNPFDLFTKLKYEYEQFQKAPLSSINALNFSMTAFFLIEWIYYHSEKKNFNSLTDFRKHIKALCPYLMLMQDIATGAKHFQLNNHDPKIRDTRLKKGAFSQGFSKGFNTSYLQIEMKDGVKLDFELAAETVIKFWDTYLNDKNKHDDGKSI